MSSVDGADTNWQRKPQCGQQVASVVLVRNNYSWPTLSPSREQKKRGPLTVHLSTHPPIRPSIHLSVHTSILLSVHPSIHPSIYSSVLLSIHPSNLLSIPPSIHPLICLSVHPPI